MGNLDLKERAINKLLKTRLNTSDISDRLWNVGFNLTVPGSVLRTLKDCYIAGEVITLSYLPKREAQCLENRLNHAQGFKEAKAGNIAVMVSDPNAPFSILGGKAAEMALNYKISGCLIDGYFRDADEILECGFPVWGRGLTPKTGRFNFELHKVNCPVSFYGVQVWPGDIAVADTSGICFIPYQVIEKVLDI